MSASFLLFSGLLDPRGFHGRRYSLDSLLSLILLGLLCGRDTLKSIWRLGHQLTLAERHALGFDNGVIPSHPLLTTLLQRLDSAALEAHLQQIVLASGGGQVEALALDGKTLRGSRSGEDRAMHVLSAFSGTLSAVLDQERMQEGENEVGAALRLLQRLSLKDTVVTGDAMFAQESVCRLIRRKGGHYLFTLKDNHKAKREAIEQALNTAPEKKTLLPDG